ncbi:MAG: hypothetical protein HY903_02440 [Deltaproteobacteria bacterium]|nr:hypothetical protein [Deltaproteobacteria bacterium]
MTQETPKSVVYLAAEGFVAELCEELGDARLISGRLVEAPAPIRPAAWAQNTWLAPQRCNIASISDAARRLKAIQRNWALYSTSHHRRAALIAAALPKVSARPLAFGAPAPTAPLGAFTLLDPDTLLFSAGTSSPFKDGEVRFVEDKTAPPNRAYLKLWEALTLFGERPRPGERCLDLGASPGGWTFVLASLGASVVAVDRAPLAPRVAEMAGVSFTKHSAFTLAPESVGPVDWWCCDVIAYPDKTLALVERWLASRLARRMICSVKFQGKTDLSIVRRFASLPNSTLRHLSHNKHELTWSYRDPELPAAAAGAGPILGG